MLESTAGTKASYSYTGSAPVWYRFSSLGGAFAEAVAATNAAGVSTITLAAGDMGYIVEHDGRQHCYWITDYSTHYLELGTITPSAEQDCGRQRFDFTGSAAEIPYYTVNGRRVELSRELKLEYTTLAFDESSFAYNPVEATEILSSIGATFSVPAAYAATEFTLSGDRFLQAWGKSQSIHTGTVQPTSVDAGTRATQAVRDADNEQRQETDGLGGSAPCDVEFEAAVTDACIFHEWQISRSPEFDINELTYTELIFDYTFREQGSTYVRFVAANADATCEYVSDTYEIFIGESKLEIPNAFSPRNEDGVNDLWKVSYKSIVSYECHIFNRWGKELFFSNDPSVGWDGKRSGKFVPPGVYYYVIQAEGADGVRYNKAGDINIIGYDQGTPGSGSSDATE
ncbi:MAG: gliding motility-associated C-terminal domain-containing protein [Roseburia sp.]|nr:gliding motility-associated C-terminal domain-containing protein [Roseburia sp.]